MSRSPSRSTQAAGRQIRATRRVRWVLMPALLTVAGCHYASSPVVGFGGFIGDTHTFNRNPNLPPGSDETMLRSQGRDLAMQPLLPEGGNIWPGPPPPEPSLEDIQKEQNVEQPLPAPNVPPGGTTVAPSPGFTPPPNFNTAPPPRLPPTPAPQALPPTPPAALPTPQGPLINNGPVGIPGGAGTATNPTTGGQSIVVPNGNGTSTIIAPDGSTQTVPTPK